MLLASWLGAGLLRDGDALVTAPDLGPLVGALGARLAVGRSALGAVQSGDAALALGAFLGPLLARQLLVLLRGDEVKHGLVLWQLQLLVCARQDPADAALERLSPCVARRFQAAVAVGVATEEEHRGADADGGEAVSAQLAASDGDLALGGGVRDPGPLELDHVGRDVAGGQLSAP